MIRFTPEDRWAAERCADEMLADARRKGMTDRWEEDWESHFKGALGEIAFARYRGKPWKCHPGDIKGKTDVDGYEVRAVAPTAKYLELKIKGTDRLSTRCVLVAHLHHYTAAIIVGWITVEEGRKLGRYADPGRKGAPAWFVNPHDLHPFPGGLRSA